MSSGTMAALFRIGSGGSTALGGGAHTWGQLLSGEITWAELLGGN